MTTHFVGQSLLIWNRATGSQKIWLILVGIMLGLSLPVLVLVFYLRCLSLLCVNIFRLNRK